MAIYAHSTARPDGRTFSPNFRPQIPARSPFVPRLPADTLSRLIGDLAPDEVKALHFIAEHGDIVTVDAEQWLLKPAPAALLDTLATVGAVTEDLGPNLDDEPSPDHEEDTEDTGIEDEPHDGPEL